MFSLASMNNQPSQAIIKKLQEENNSIKQENDNIKQEKNQLLKAQEILNAKQQELENERLRLKDEIEKLKFHNKILRDAIKGKKSEKWTEDDKKYATLFNEAEFLEEKAVKEAKEEKIHVPAHERKKSRGKRNSLSDNLPTREQVIDLTGEEKTCGCGEQLHRIGEEVSKQVEFIPAHIQVIKTIRPKYACKACEGSGDEQRSGIKIAKMPPSIYPKSIFSTNSWAYISVLKFLEGLPLFRIARILERLGLDASDSTLSRGLIHISDKLKPITDSIRSSLLANPIAQCDETPLKVLKLGEDANQVSYMWALRSGFGEKYPYVYYHFNNGRSASILVEWLQDFKGIFQTDGFSSYAANLSGLSNITLAGCNVHARRKFKEIGSSNEVASYVLTRYREIYKYEDEFKRLNLDKESKEKKRRELILPIMEEMKKRLLFEKQKLFEGNPLYKAIQYFLNHYDKLIVFISDGNLPPDTNSVENAIRPIATGRKTWQFAGSKKGAEASAILFTYIENAKLCKLEPYRCLAYALHQLAINPNTDPRTLTPQFIAKNNICI